MREILQQCDDLRQKLLGETEQMMIERVMMRDIASARSRELFLKRDEEFRRIERWYESQKAAVEELFTAMISECEADLKKHDAAIKLLSADGLVRKDETQAKPNTAAETAVKSELQDIVSELEAKLDRLTYRDTKANGKGPLAEAELQPKETGALLRPTVPAAARPAGTSRRSVYR